ncbi:hypothetical protein [Paraburkholderia fungorum]|uniref:hypothetical protein n=1 Tax=Paraburkholderia fungorum TaxID=134537 RepID=UPI000DB6DBC1|nr:hypothetical protein [Paraburkholderia fungorum]PZR45667.1 MAG: hypothetical protein DI523_20275 [Paraburkholderia fungorum]
MATSGTCSIRDWVGYLQRHVKPRPTVDHQIDQIDQFDQFDQFGRVLDDHAGLMKTAIRHLHGTTGRLSAVETMQIEW